MLSSAHVTLLVAFIGILPSIITIVVNRRSARETRKDAAKNSILLLIMLDKQKVSEGELPVNYERVLHEFDVYRTNFGNSYMEAVIGEYKSWYDQLTIKEK